MRTGDHISLTRRQVTLCILLVAIGCVSVMHVTQAQSGDPLTPEERQMAADVALKSQAEAGFLRNARPEDKTTVVATMLAPRTETDGRKAVVFLKSGTTTAVQVLVDLTSRRAESWRELPVASIPLTPDDVAEALKIAAADQQVRGFVPNIETFSATAQDPEARVVEGIRSIGAGRNDPCSRDRCIALLFREGRRYVTNLSVTVNLTTRKVQTAVKNAR